MNPLTIATRRRSFQKPLSLAASTSALAEPIGANYLPARAAYIGRSSVQQILHSRSARGHSRRLAPCPHCATLTQSLLEPCHCPKLPYRFPPSRAAARESVRGTPRPYSYRGQDSSEGERGPSITTAVSMLPGWGQHPLRSTASGGDASGGPLVGSVARSSWRNPAPLTGSWSHTRCRSVCSTHGQLYDEACASLRTSDLNAAPARVQQRTRDREP